MTTKTVHCYHNIYKQYTDNFFTGIQKQLKHQKINQKINRCTMSVLEFRASKDSQKFIQTS